MFIACFYVLICMFNYENKIHVIKTKQGNVKNNNIIRLP